MNALQIHFCKPISRGGGGVFINIESRKFTHK